ncbi:MAG: hypothetical protein WAM60_02625 [Candidatus Promineifilaceae bacterium]
MAAENFQKLFRVGPYRFRYLLYVVVAVGLTWPLGAQMGDRLPLGTEGSATVPLFNLWTLMWNADRLQHGYAGYWDAPAFYPERGTFALSEPQPLTGVIFSAADLGGNPVAAYDLVLLLFLALNGISADWLLRKLGVETIPALLGGLLAMALPFVSNEWGVLQLTAVFPLFFALGSLWSFVQRPGWLAALGIGGWSGAAFLFSNYYGLFLTVFLLLGGLCLLHRALLRRKVVVQVLGAAVLAGAILLPVLPEQVRLTAEYGRSDYTIQSNSADIGEYLHLYRRTLGEHWLPWIAEDDGSQRLYPGTMLLMLGILGMIVGWRDRPKRRWVFFAAFGAVLAFMLSLGLNLSAGGWQPYRLLKDYYPGFAQLRSPFRLAVLVQIFLVSLAGIGLNVVWRRGRGGRLLAVGLVTLGLVEVVAHPVRLYAVPETVFEADWITWLKDQPEDGAVLMIPMSQGSSTRDFQPTVIGMLQGLQHGRPVGNGYSGFFPRSYTSLNGRMFNFPDDETIQYLQETGFTYLVIDRDWWDEDKTQALSAWGGEVDRVYADREKVIYRVAR